MRKLYKKTMLIFLRSKNLSVPYFVMLALLLALFAFRFFKYLHFLNIFNTVRWLVLPCVFLIACFIYFSYELAIKMYDHNMADYLKTYRQGLWKVYQANILCLLTIVAIPALMFLVYILFFYNYINVQYYPFLIHLIKVSTLYFGLSLVAGIMLGTAMAAKLKTKRLAVYSFTVIFILLNTTFSVILCKIPYSLFKAYHTEKILFYIKDFCTLVPHQLGSNFIIDPIYGLPMEPIRWILALFWILFPLTLILTECFDKKIKKVLTVTSCLLVVLGVGLFSFRGSTLIMDMRANSYPLSDPFYYQDRPKVDYQGYKAGFAIKDYDMDLTVSNELHAEVKVSVDNPHLDRYEFTLYHGYKLTSVRTENGAIPFTREGDYIRIRSLKGLDRIIFKYHGTSLKYYANRQAIALPGYFVYYPKAGRSNIWDYVRNSYVANISPHESDYTVNIRSNLNVFSNLAGSNNSFHGKSNGVSLFAGMYDEIAENVYAEPLRSDQPSRKDVREAQKILNDTFKRLGRPQLSPVFSEKKLFQVPSNFGLNSKTENIILMSDHITFIYCDGPNLAWSIMDSFTKPKSDALFRWNYLSYLIKQGDAKDRIFKSTDDLNLLLQDIAEARFLKGKGGKITAYENRRKFELIESVNEKAPQYLFYESPHQEENLRTFFDYFTSESQEDYLGLAERIIREEMEHVHS